MRNKKHKKNSLSSKRQAQNQKNNLRIITPDVVAESEFAAIARASMYGDEQFGELIHYQGWREF